ncbi:hypothetical protein [Microbacterium sp. SSM24]|uniref:hypothetical protein n=1 Tax=Microbacterium sp. SSM24 TaxID=2991714 RepID=UPI0022270139|nr:hypothetical protein [Microbacterium sp. SSM24]MCW3494016.1 hypothetical protein [Microbacterium sp. SSM24]
MTARHSGILATAAVGLASLIVGILAVVRARPRWPGIVGLAVTVGVLLFLAARMVLV